MSAKDFASWKDCSGNSGYSQTSATAKLPVSDVNNFNYMQDSATLKCVLNHSWDINPPAYNFQPSSNPNITTNTEYIPSTITLGS
jgi:hypothetical protein